MAGILLENTGSDQARASLARKMASEQAKIAAVNMERARQQDGAAKLKAAEYIPGNIVKDTTVPAGANNYVSEIPQDRRRGGFRLYSDVAEVLMTVVEDTVGRHDTIGGAWSPRSTSSGTASRARAPAAPIFWLLCGNEGCPVATSMPM